MGWERTYYKPKSIWIKFPITFSDPRFSSFELIFLTRTVVGLIFDKKSFILTQHSLCVKLKPSSSESPIQFNDIRVPFNSSTFKSIVAGRFGKRLNRSDLPSVRLSLIENETKFSNAGFLKFFLTSHSTRSFVRRSFAILLSNQTINSIAKLESTPSLPKKRQKSITFRKVALICSINSQHSRFLLGSSLFCLQF